jgi:hypothetical protein
MIPRIFCSELSRTRGEQVFGTAPRVDTWLLIEHPGAWSAKGFPDDRLSPPVKHYMESLARFLGAKRLMIRHRRRGETLRLFFIRSSELDPSVSMVSFRAYEDLLQYSAAELVQQARPHDRPLFLVCTHGKHDKCCAKFGFGIYCGLLNARPEDTWECSHVGGDRFAANIVCFPEGTYYGHVSREAAARIAAEHVDGRIFLDCYRGRCCYGRPAQIAEYVIRRETGLNGIGDLVFVNEAEVSRGEWFVEFLEVAGGRVHEVQFRLRKSSARHLLTCHAVEAKPVSEYFAIRYALRT